VTNLGDPKKTRRKYDKPSHPWQGDRIEEEKALLEEYGLQNKKEIWRMKTILKRFKDQVKNLASRIDEQGRLEEKQLVSRLISLGLMRPSDPLDVILGLSNKDVFERRLQTLLVRKGLARSMNQARQFITHGHIIVDNKKITFPSYMVSVKEEALVEFVPTSTLSKQDHPERMIKETPKEKAEKKKKEQKEEAPLVFSEEEITALEEKGALIKKAEEAAAKEAKAKEAKEARPAAKHEKKEKEKKQE
jgi:small subunit ribosomal protein S4